MISATPSPPRSTGVPVPQPASSSCQRCPKPWTYGLGWDDGKVVQASKSLPRGPHSGPGSRAPAGCLLQSQEGLLLPLLPPSSEAFSFTTSTYFLIYSWSQRPREGTRLLKVTQRARGPKGLDSFFIDDGCSDLNYTVIVSNPPSPSAEVDTSSEG